MIRKMILFSCLMAGIAGYAASTPGIDIVPGNQPQKIWLAEEAAEDARAGNVTIRYFVPEKPNGTAVLICPGGGYGGLCDSYEGNDVAKWLNKYGVTGVVLRYRVGRDLKTVPFLDVMRAMTLVRLNAGKFGIKPDRIGVMGFSAGGHLASVLATHGSSNPQTRPDFQILIYPVITFGEKTHRGSRDNFLGPAVTPAMIKLFSSELQVSKNSPTAFVCHAVTDQLVPVDNSRAYVTALRKKNIPVEYLELPKGAHGLGCGSGPEWKAWQDGCIAWMQKLGLADRPAGEKK